MLGELLSGGDVGYELSLDPTAPIVVASTRCGPSPGADRLGQRGSPVGDTRRASPEALDVGRPVGARWPGSTNEPESESADREYHDAAEAEASRDRRPGRRGPRWPAAAERPKTTSRATARDERRRRRRGPRRPAGAGRPKMTTSRATSRPATDDVEGHGGTAAPGDRETTSRATSASRGSTRAAEAEPTAIERRRRRRGPQARRRHRRAHVRATRAQPAAGPGPRAGHPAQPAGPRGTARRAGRTRSD